MNINSYTATEEDISRLIAIMTINYERHSNPIRVKKLKELKELLQGWVNVIDKALEFLDK